jgi:glutamate-1-semialdehyde 2,1-aminomutase
MKHIAPLGAVYQAGTLSGNPLAMAAGIATLKELFKPGFYETIEERGKLLDAGMEAALKNSPVPGQFKRIDSKFGLFFTAQEVVDYESAKTSDTKAYASFFWNLVDRGVYFAPSQFEAGFMSFAHTPEIIEETLAAVRESLAALAVAV